MNVNPEVDEWFARKKPVQSEAMLRVREIFLGADPRIEETIKWSTPTFMHKGNIASFNPAKKTGQPAIPQGRRDPRPSSTPRRRG